MTRWGILCLRVPWPIPNYDKLPSYHYKHVSDTDVVDVNGKPREVDDFNPRKKLKEAVKDGKISLNDRESIQEYADKYTDEMKHVRQFIEKFSIQDMEKTKKSSEKRQASEKENEQSYHDIDWKRCHQENSVVKLKIKTLNKYLAYHQMNNCLKRKKKEKCDVIMQHITAYF